MKELIQRLIADCIADLIEDQTSKGITASGASAASMDSTNVTDEGGQLTGFAYIFDQINGKPPGHQPNVQDIIDWIEAKRIQIKGKSIQSAAYFIARKIGQRGTDIYLKKRPGLNFDFIINHNADLFQRNAVDELEHQIIKDIYERFKQN